MATVYVKWYGNVLEGEMLNGDYLGMKQVVIPLDGHRPIALFTPEHVYNSPEQIAENTQLISKNQQIISNSDVSFSKDRQIIEVFKAKNWDQERNHLRIDKLDEFYKLWRMVVKQTC